MKKVTSSILGFLLFLMYLSILTSCEEANGKEKILAKIDNKEITLKEYMGIMEQLPEAAREAFSDEKGKKELLDDIIKRELIIKEAKKQRIDKDEDVIKKIKAIEKRVLIEEFLKRTIEDKIKIKESEIKEFFNAHNAASLEPDEVKASHILVKTEAEAKDILKKLKKGEDFAKLAAKYSIDPGSKKQGGSLGYFKKGQMVPEFEKAAFNLKRGEISPIVKTKFGYHIIKLYDKRMNTAMAYDDAKEDLRKYMVREKQKKMFDELVSELKSKANITIYDKVLKETNITQTQR
ncbi:MAG: peptidylprolyl isomerase [Nitrospirota bacterium]